ncbi:cysteine-rich venom protein triflin-like [Anolis sagrei]|uniref:cysteine-rich venom protein triflin-like n=1 Tax=Anolis sagrei TaxID=38937 RepID=UPI00352286C0
MLLQNVFLLLIAVVLQSSPGQADGSLSEVSELQKKEIIDIHNEIRRKVQPTSSNMMKMMWNDNAAMSAGRWASKCLGKSSSIEDRMMDGVQCGELTLKTTYPTTWHSVIELFASGQSYFQYGTGTTDSSKHVNGYTQIVWHNSNQMGCALAFCPQSPSNFIYVCHYCPGGNIVEQLKTPYKKGPPCGDCAGSCEDNLCINSCPYIDQGDDCRNLVEMFTCAYPFAEQRCAATCKCPKE